jgi:hypothetical protein
MGKYLVVRCGTIDGVNPIEEVDRAMSLHGHCWFGKYGQPIVSIARHANKSPLTVVLAGARAVDHCTTAQSYTLETWSTSIPKDGCFPPYYKSTLSRIKTWLKLTPAQDGALSVSDLVVERSLQPLAYALRGSMRGHFWCVDKRRTLGS